MSGKAFLQSLFGVMGVLFAFHMIFLQPVGEPVFEKTEKTLSEGTAHEVENAEKKALVQKIKEQVAQHRVEGQDKGNSSGNNLTHRILSVIECAEGGRCESKSTQASDSPMAEALAFRQKVLTLLEKLKSEIDRNNYAYESLAQLTARYFIQTSDYALQLGSLLLFENLPQSQENRDSIMRGVRGTLNERVLDKALVVLEEYNSPSDKKEIAQFVLDNILNGTFVVAPLAADKSRRFMSLDNFQAFEETLTRLDSNSTTHFNLSLSLKDFKLTHGIF